MIRVLVLFQLKQRYVPLTILSLQVLLQDGLEVAQKDSQMKRVLGLFQLSAFGISAIIGGGIFVVTGLQAKNNAG
jgi:APA family basic amino acid/polyamine antiporter